MAGMPVSDMNRIEDDILGRVDFIIGELDKTVPPLDEPMQKQYLICIFPENDKEGNLRIRYEAKGTILGKSPTTIHTPSG